ncbi:MAG TPA: shikimate kinase [Casimicrobiaceae bacterium]|nr:shikimate kinase [Casimicrobiaceae bacterium]
MGAGKTTLGRALAKRLDKRFVDADHELEARLGVTIPTIFEVEGEAGFRDREEAVIAELTRLTDIVLSTGGGAVMRAGSRARLRESGTVLYLHAKPEVLWQRLRGSRHRPMLQAADPRTRLVDLYTLRDPLYREVAHHVIESDRDAVMRFVRWLDADSQDDVAASTPGAEPADSADSAGDADSKSAPVSPANEDK